MTKNKVAMNKIKFYLAIMIFTTTLSANIFAGDDAREVANTVNRFKMTYERLCKATETLVLNAEGDEAQLKEALNCHNIQTASLISFALKAIEQRPETIEIARQAAESLAQELAKRESH